MSSRPDSDRSIAAWLEAEAPDRAPDRLLAASRDRLRTTNQRRAWWPAWRIAGANGPAILLGASAAVLIVAVVGFNLLPRDVGVGAPAPVVEPSPQPSSSPTPSATYISTARGWQDLTAGTYRVGYPFAVPFSISLTQPWIAHNVSEGDVTLERPNAGQESTWIVVQLVENVYADPCNAAGGPMDPPVAPTVDAIVEALRSMKGVAAGPVAEIVIDGKPARTFTLRSTIDTATAGCSHGTTLPLWTYRGGSAPTATDGSVTDIVSVLDVGGTPVLIDDWGPDIPEADPAPAIEQLLGAIDFDQ
jgi:hypothetical protein